MVIEVGLTTMLQEQERLQGRALHLDQLEAAEYLEAQAADRG